MQEQGMLGTTPEDIAQFLHQEERLDSVRKLTSNICILYWYLCDCIKEQKEKGAEISGL